MGENSCINCAYAGKNTTRYLDGEEIKEGIEIKGTCLWEAPCDVPAAFLAHAPSSLRVVVLSPSKEEYCAAPIDFERPYYDCKCWEAEC